MLAGGQGGEGLMPVGHVDDDPGQLDRSARARADQPAAQLQPVAAVPDLILGIVFAVALERAALGALGGELSAMLPVQGVGGFGTYEAGVAFGLLGGPGDWTSLLVPAFALHSFTLLFAAASGILAWIALPDALPVAVPMEKPE